MTYFTIRMNFFASFFFSTFLFERQIYIERRRGKRSYICWWASPQPGSQSFWGSHVGAGAIFCCFFRNISRDLDGKWDSQNLNCCPYGMPEPQAQVQQTVPWCWPQHTCFVKMSVFQYSFQRMKDSLFVVFIQLRGQMELEILHAQVCPHIPAVSSWSCTRPKPGTPSILVFYMSGRDSSTCTIISCLPRCLLMEG